MAECTASRVCPATARDLTTSPMRRHLRVMSAGLILPHLRRSLLGAWLAVAYALAVLAAGLAPAPAHAAVGGWLLCSGSSAPLSEAPAPAGEASHCKGCPANPVLANPPAPETVAFVRRARPVAALAAARSGIVASPAWRLPPSHAPPRADA